MSAPRIEMNRGLLALVFAMAAWGTVRTLDFFAAKWITSIGEDAQVRLYSGIFVLGILSGLVVLGYSIRVVVRRKAYSKRPWLLAVIPAMLISSLMILGTSYGASVHFSDRRTKTLAREKMNAVPDSKRASLSENEAEERKQRTIELLQGKGVPTLDHLPVIVDSRSAQPRNVGQIAFRAMALAAVGMKAEGIDPDELNDFVRENSLEHFFSSDEKAFIEDPDPGDHDRLQFSWRYESFWTLLWVLGEVDSLDPNTEPSDPAEAFDILGGRNAAELIADSNLRDLDSILDEADRSYRYHWALRNSDLKGEAPPEGVNHSVIIERHYVLNWVIGYGGDNWDEVPTDT